MLEPFRSDFNSRFTPEKYRLFLDRLNESTRPRIEFRISETPCFFPRALIEELSAIGAALTQQLVGSPAYMAASARAVPDRYRVPNESAHPHFMTADFGLTRDGSGMIVPKLVELQAFPSIFGYQSVACREYVATYGLDQDLGWLPGMSEEEYWELLRSVIVGDHDPENVILAEIEPDTQKTLPDFNVYEDRLGIKTVDIARLKKEGKQLFYQKDRSSGPWIPVRRIFNRAIVDELERKQIRLNFDYRDELDVEWAGHPNWYFRISKFSLPFLDHPAVPKTIFLDAWFDEDGAKEMPADRNKLILKPLYSFAGRGIQFAPTDEDLASIPEAERSLYLLQERVQFEPVIKTPYGMTQAEIRIMYLWPDGGDLQPTINLVRMGRGLMMGVDHNKDQLWVGGSAGLFL